MSFKLVVRVMRLFDCRSDHMRDFLNDKTSNWLSLLKGQYGLIIM